MAKNQNQKPASKPPYLSRIILYVVASGFLAALIFSYLRQTRPTISLMPNAPQVKSADLVATTSLPQLDTAAYDAKLLAIANNPFTSSATSANPSLWPAKAVYPKAGALLPFNRIVAYYGNLYSKNMGVLGQYPENEMLDRLNTEAQKWQTADPSTPVIPALHYIAVVAQAGGGRDGKYRLRMPDSEIQKVLTMADKIHGLVFLDLQVGQSNVQTELPLLTKYLQLPNVHLGIDPEFSMKNGGTPGTKIGTLDAADVNYAAQFLAGIVQQNNLPPKILVVHRFTQGMLTNYQQITPLPEVQIVVNMDGFGGQAKKLNTYKQFIAKQPVQFTGFKLFYKNDTANGNTMFAPEQLLKLNPIPVYIQYQ